ncbi:velvet factor-domain-containing protein [Chytridium lagenaria]|nr:velvet factor-domain-containing protein [Chytridium lagenaria]
MSSPLPALQPQGSRLDRLFLPLVHSLTSLEPNCQQHLRSAVPSSNHSFSEVHSLLSRAQSSLSPSLAGSSSIREGNDLLIEESTFSTVKAEALLFISLSQARRGPDNGNGVPNSGAGAGSGSVSSYILKLRQQPKHSRMCGFGEKVDRRPVDPPPIIQLEINDAGSTDENSYLYNPYYFMYASLISQDSEEELHLLRDGKTRSTTGSIVSSLYRLKDLDNKDGAFFVFPDLSVRMEGAYRLKFSLFEIINTEIYFCASICSDVFSKSFSLFSCDQPIATIDVYPAKKFPGMEESTFLSRTFAEQGLKIRIRKELRIRSSIGRPRAKRGADGDGSPEPSSSGAGGGGGGKKAGRKKARAASDEGSEEEEEEEDEEEIVETRKKVKTSDGEKAMAPMPSHYGRGMYGGPPPHMADPRHYTPGPPDPSLYAHYGRPPPMWAHDPTAQASMSDWHHRPDFAMRAAMYGGGPYHDPHYEHGLGGNAASGNTGNGVGGAGGEDSAQQQRGGGSRDAESVNGGGDRSSQAQPQGGDRSGAAGAGAAGGRQGGDGANSTGGDRGGFYGGGAGGAGASDGKSEVGGGGAAGGSSGSGPSPHLHHGRYPSPYGHGMPPGGPGHYRGAAGGMGGGRGGAGGDGSGAGSGSGGGSGNGGRPSPGPSHAHHPGMYPPHYGGPGHLGMGMGIGGPGGLPMGGAGGYPGGGHPMAHGGVGGPGGPGAGGPGSAAAAAMHGGMGGLGGPPPHMMGGAGMGMGGGGSGGVSGQNGDERGAAGTVQPREVGMQAAGLGSLD